MTYFIKQSTYLNTIVRILTEFVNEYQYLKTLSLIRSPSEDLKQPTVDKYLLNEDVIKVMDTIYSTSIYPRQLHAGNVGTYFSKNNEAIILSFDEVGNPVQE